MQNQIQTLAFEMERLYQKTQVLPAFWADTKLGGVNLKTNSSIYRGTTPWYSAAQLIGFFPVWLNTSGTMTIKSGKLEYLLFQLSIDFDENQEFAFELALCEMLRLVEIKTRQSIT